MRLLWDYIKKYKRLLAAALTLGAVNQIFSLLDPQLFRIIVDKYATNPGEFSNTEFLTGVGLLLGGIVSVALISRTAKAFQDYFVSNLTQSVGAKMYADSIRHVFGLSYESFEDERSGSILLNLQKARDDSIRFLSPMINIVFLSAIGIIFVIVYAFFVNHWIALCFILLIPVVSVTSYYLSLKIKEAQSSIVKESADLSGSTTETLRNVGLVKSLGLERQEVTRLNKVNDILLSLEIKKIVMVRKLVFLQGTMVNAVRVLILFVSLYLIWQGAISLGEFMTFMFYTFFVFSPLYSLSELVSTYQEARASIEALSQILSMKGGEYEKGEMEIRIINSVSFKNVDYRYKNAESDSVSNISFDIQPGKTVALVGPSGSGKSTLIKVLAGLYKPGKGEFEINGESAEKIDFGSYREKLGLVRQETELFAGTIRENLLFVKPEASDHELREVMKKSSAESLLLRGSKEIGVGLDARIGEAGLKLSGGERQRLAIARALLRNPDLLIFDEATSALDSITEKEINKTIEDIRKQNPNLMMLLVAHRLSTIVSSDVIHVMSKGQIVESGTHAELLDQGGLYWALWKEQSS